MLMHCQTRFRLGTLDCSAGAFMNNGSGTTYRAAIADGLDTSDDETVESTFEDRNVDAFKLDFIMGFGEIGKVAFVHKNYDITHS